MATSTDNLLTKLKSIMHDMHDHKIEAEDLEKLYFSEVNTNTAFTLLLSSVAATFSTSLSKGECVNGVTFISEVVDFFSNDAVTQGDYNATIQSIKYGEDEFTSPGLSPACEAYGERLKAFCEEALDLFNRCKEVLDLYNDTEISSALTALSGDSIPWYDNLTVADFTSGITAAEQYKKLINNEAVTTGDYAATVAKWARIS